MRVYFVQDGMDVRTQHLLEMNDPERKKNKGALLTTEYGKGRFVYAKILVSSGNCRAGVPGAYRLNLISAKKQIECR